MKKIILLILVTAFSFCLSGLELELAKRGEIQGIELESFDENGLEVRAGVERLEYFTFQSEKGEFSELSTAGFGYGGEAGSPRLTVKREFISVPLGAEVRVNILAIEQEEHELSQIGMSRLMPTQPPMAKSADPAQVKFVYKESAYTTDKWYGDEVITCEEVGILRGMRLFTITYYPLSYNPVQGRLKINNDVHASVTFVGSDRAVTEELRQKTFSPAFEGIYAANVLNYDKVLRREDITRYPIKYVIISDIMFQTQLEPFIDWKTAQGYEVIEAYTSEIGSSTTAIANYIESLWEEATPTDPAPSFILFVGDTDQIPAYNGSQGSHVTDLNYVRLEGGDFLPEVYYGRFSARNAAELQPQIDKTLEYEMYNMPDPSYLEEVVMIAGMDTYHGSQWGNGQINYGTENYFNASHGITSHTYLYPNSGNNSANIIQNVSEGVGYINYTAHGSSTTWADPSFTISNINNLANEHKYPLAVGNCCLTNKFEVGECFGEAWLREENGGSIGYIGGTNSTYWDEDFWWGVGAGTISSNPTYAGTGLGAYDGMFHDHGEEFENWYISQSSFIMAGNLAVVAGGGSANYYWEIYSLMGDPSLVPYFGVPEQNNVSHAGQIFIGSSSYSLSAEPYSYVGISLEGELLAGGLVDETGNITLEFAPVATAGMLDLVVSCQNHEPFMAEIQAVPNEGAFLSITDQVIISSDGDDLIEHGETIELSLQVENVGVDAATDVSVSISTADPYITITESEALVAVIGAGSTAMISGLEFEVLNTVPDNHSISFDVSFEYNEGDNSGTLNFTAHAPILGLGNVYITSDDNNNGRLDPGELADLELEITNSGSSTVQNVICMVYAGSEYITVSNTWSFIPEIEPGSSGIYPFMVEVSEDCPVGESVTFSVEVEAEVSIIYNSSFALNVGLNLEDFESGDFLSWDWELSGDTDWFITSSSPYEGSYCAESGDIGNNEISALSIELDVLYDDEISFYRKVSSESGWDKLFFYIDGEEQENWSGTQGWEQFSYTLSAGTHEVSWVYDKDGSVSSGSDCAWVDYIVFPAIGIPQPPEMTCSVSDISQTIELNSTVSSNFTITNSGGGTLYYYLSMAETDSRSIEGSTLTCDTETYLPGEQVTWNLEVFNNSGDAEWLTDVIVDFPAGVSVVSATDFTGASGDLVYNGTSGAGVSVEWNDPNGGWGQIHGQETATASVTVMIDANQAGDILLNWTLIGDDYGSTPHEVQGTITLSTEVMPLGWAELSQYSGILNPQEMDEITITFDSSGLDQGIYTADLIINDNREITIIPITLTVGGDIAWGDVDDNGTVEALDASVVLQYAVGIDPSPFAPLPWESWRLLRADVDGNDFVEAYDASLILQYFVGMINSFPVENTRTEVLEDFALQYLLADDQLTFVSDQEVFSLLISTNDVSVLGEAVFARDVMNAQNKSANYRAAFASAEAISGNLMSIPVNIDKIEHDLKFEVWINGNRNFLIITREELEAAGLPQATVLSANYPNPFNPSTTISYALAAAGEVSLSVFNIKGQIVKTLIAENQDPGEYEVIWQGDNNQNKSVPSGIYFYRLSAAGMSCTKKMILMK